MIFRFFPRKATDKVIKATEKKFSKLLMLLCEAVRPMLHITYCEVRGGGVGVGCEFVISAVGG